VVDSYIFYVKIILESTFFLINSSGVVEVGNLIPNF
jgi:hypothetical protein